MSTFRDGEVVREPAEPLRREQFLPADSPEARAEQLGRMMVALAETTEAVRRDRHVRSRVFEGLACGTGGASITIRHGLGRVARWAVVDWRRTAPGGSHGLERHADGNDADTLVLRSYVAGTASIEVW